MKYLNTHLGEIVEGKKIVVRKGNEEDVKGKKDVKIPAYVVELDKGRHKMYSCSGMELLIKLVNDLRLTKIPVEADIQFSSDKKLYPYHDPNYGVKSIIDTYNMAVEPYNFPISENPNPFLQRVQKVLILEQAREMLAEIKSLR